MTTPASPRVPSLGSRGQSKGSRGEAGGTAEGRSASRSGSWAGRLRSHVPVSSHPSSPCSSHDSDLTYLSPRRPTHSERLEPPSTPGLGRSAVCWRQETQRSGKGPKPGRRVTATERPSPARAVPELALGSARGWPGLRVGARGSHGKVQPFDHCFTCDVLSLAAFEAFSLVFSNLSRFVVVVVVVVFVYPLRCPLSSSYV